jgi:hypothetical protein
VTKLSSVPPHKDKTEGFRVTHFGGGYDSVTVTSVDKGKSKKFNSCGSAQHCSPAYRSCDNDCRIVMVLLLIPSQLLR